MSKFTESEREQIYQSLLTKGKERFIKYGLAKTSIDDLVQACGIGKGSFYKFFSSKEELFYTILKKEEEIRNQTLQELMRENLTPKELITSFFQKSFQLADAHPLLHQVFQDGEYERIIRKVPKQLIEGFTQDDLHHGRKYIQALMHQGVVKEQDPDVVVGIIRAIMMLATFKEKIGQDMFPKVMDQIIDYIAEGLTTSKK